MVTPGRPLLRHRYSWRHPAWPIYRQRLLKSDQPILVGPWHDEVGFEALYWIPFVDHLKKLGVKPERLIPISRGGAAHWYGTPTGLELYAMRTPQEVRIENRRRFQDTGYLKQFDVSAFDRAVLTDAAQTLGVGKDYLTLHPAWMYHTYAPYWTGYKGFQWLTERMTFARLTLPPLPGGVRLPPKFMAVRFYGRDTWHPKEKVVIEATKAVLEQLASRGPVVLIDHPYLTDDHLEFHWGALPGNVRMLSDLCPSTIETNLALQSAIIGRAECFVGTYGGVAQLALRMGRPTTAFYHEWQHTSVAHKMLSDWVSINEGVPFVMSRIAEWPLISLTVPAAELKPVEKPRQGFGMGVASPMNTVPSSTPPPGATGDSMSTAVSIPPAVAAVG